MAPKLKVIVGPPMDATEHQYRSSDALGELFAAVCAVSGAALAPLKREVAVAMVAGAGYLAWRTVRAWRTPYVELSSKRLVVFEGGCPKHCIEFAEVASVSQGLNRTVFFMRDGMKTSVSHLGFRSSNDVRHFRQKLAERFVSIGTASLTERVPPSEPSKAEYTGPRCVRCREPIQPGIKTCPKCGWAQP